MGGNITEERRLDYKLQRERNSECNGRVKITDSSSRFAVLLI